MMYSNESKDVIWYSTLGKTATKNSYTHKYINRLNRTKQENEKSHKVPKIFASISDDARDKG